VALTDPERKSLNALLRRRKAAKRDLQRAEIALMADRGETTTAIAKRLGVSKQMVSKWRGRLALRGTDGLVELPRSGHPRRINDGARLQLIALACEPAEEDGRTTPTLDELAARAVERGIVSAISRRHLHRILEAGDIHPHRIQQWLHSPDPQFREKTNEICELYRKPPEGSVVLCVDEKTSIQAIERKMTDRAPAPGRLRRREFGYIRHGIQTLLAAMDVHTGQAVISCGITRTQKDLLAFMNQVAQVHPKGMVDIIWDNLNTHLVHRWEAFNQTQGRRFRFHFTPLHASWVNQIELLFSTYARQCLRNASHTSTDHLRRRTEAFFLERNAHPKPFKWSFRGYHLQTGEPKRKPGRRSYAESLCHA
jgi:transposase